MKRVLTKRNLLILFFISSAISATILISTKETIKNDEPVRKVSNPNGLLVSQQWNEKKVSDFPILNVIFDAIIVKDDDQEVDLDALRKDLANSKVKTVKLKDSELVVFSVADLSDIHVQSNNSGAAGVRHIVFLIHNGGARKILDEAFYEITGFIQDSRTEIPSLIFGCDNYHFDDDIASDDQSYCMYRYEKNKYINTRKRLFEKDLNLIP